MCVYAVRLVINSISCDSISVPVVGEGITEPVTPNSKGASVVVNVTRMGPASVTKPVKLIKPSSMASRNVRGKLGDETG